MSSKVDVSFLDDYVSSKVGCFKSEHACCIKCAIINILVYINKLIHYTLWYSWENRCDSSNYMQRTCSSPSSFPNSVVLKMLKSYHAQDMWDLIKLLLHLVQASFPLHTKPLSPITAPTVIPLSFFSCLPKCHGDGRYEAERRKQALIIQLWMIFCNIDKLFTFWWFVWITNHPFLEAEPTSQEEAHQCNYPMAFITLSLHTNFRVSWKYHRW